MLKTYSAVTLVALLSALVPALAGEPSAANGLWERETLTDNWLGLGRKLAEGGVEIALSATQVVQMNARGGLSTDPHQGRYAGSYDLELTLDLDKLVRLPGATVFVLAEGSWNDGIADRSVGDLFGVNDDAGSDRSIDVTEMWHQQNLLDDRLRVRVGKIDLTGGFECRGCAVAFDANAFANDETAQFINGALVNNPTIPFPDNGLGVAVFLEPLKGWYLAGGVQDARADACETGLRTAFHGRDYFFSIFETGITPRIPSPAGPLQGAYRVGFWYDPQPKQRFGGGTKPDDTGFYLSFDQALARENTRDAQGLGVFARYGFAHSDVNEIRCFWSAGAQYQGLLPTRDDDTLGIGFAQGRLSPGAGFGADHESVLEVYYSAHITPWLALTPSVQYVWNPGGDSTLHGAVVLGVRLQLSL